MPQVSGLVGATGPEGTQLGADIACKIDEQTEIRTGMSHIKESTFAEQATEILIIFGTTVGAQLLATWLYDKISKRNGGRLEIEGLTIELDKGKIERILIDKLGKTDDDDEYLRKLDSLARFYNSEKTVHAGYLITSFVVIVALLSTIANVVFSQTLQGLIFCQRVAVMSAVLATVCACYFFINKPLPFLFTYLFGRMQFYNCLSEMTWLHMGVTTNDNDFVRRLRIRTSSSDLDGIRSSLIRLFEAYLYVSAFRQKRGIEPSKDADDEPEELRSTNWRERFACDGLDFNWTSQYYNGKLLWAWDRTTVLLRAYKSQLNEYGKQKESSRERKIYDLFHTLDVV